MPNNKPIYNGLPEKFWVVTKCPSSTCILEDIMFETDIPGIIRQYLGGLRWEDVAGVRGSRETAEEQVNKLLDFFRST